jgi:hypothetical protein
MLNILAKKLLIVQAARCDVLDKYFGMLNIEHSGVSGGAKTHIITCINSAIPS